MLIREFGIILENVQRSYLCYVYENDMKTLVFRHGRVILYSEMVRIVTH